MASDIGLRIDNRYEVLGELGRGGMGVVYKAADLKMDRVVAIKVLTAHVVGKEEYRERFLREARSVAKLQHPNIVVVHDYGDHAGSPYMAMEYVEGTPLDKLIASGVNLSLIVKLDYIIQVAHALNYAHQFGIIHRDVKPGNIMVLEGGQRVKLLDFGIARAGGASMLSKSGLAMGTIYYMSPQQTKGQKDLDGRADIFSLGVVLYELLAGRLPWTGDSDYEVMSKIISEPFPPLSHYLQNYPPEFDQVLERALSKEVNGRYQKAEELAVELAELQTPLKEMMLHDARTSFQEGDVLRAHELVSQILRIDTRHGEALEFRNRLQQVAQLDQKTEQVRQLRAAAEQALGEKRYQDALGAIDEAVALNASNPELLQYRELVRQEIKRKEEVRKKLELAKRAEEINDLASAQELVDKALELDPSDTQARMLKSVLARRAEEEEKQTRLQELAEQVKRGLASRRYTDVHEVIRQIEALDPDFAPLAALKKAAVDGYAQEMRRRELEGLIRRG
jgi:tetratricopeptide (TPR) repeat protein/predicted Ser/Thr protein kinase